MLDEAPPPERPAPRGAWAAFEAAVRRGCADLGEARVPAEGVRGGLLPNCGHGLAEQAPGAAAALPDVFGEEDRP